MVWQLCETAKIRRKPIMRENPYMSKPTAIGPTKEWFSLLGTESVQSRPGSRQVYRACPRHVPVFLHHADVDGVVARVQLGEGEGE